MWRQKSPEKIWWMIVKTEIWTSLIPSPTPPHPYFILIPHPEPMGQCFNHYCWKNKSPSKELWLKITIILSSFLIYETQEFRKGSVGHFQCEISGAVAFSDLSWNNVGLEQPGLGWHPSLSMKSGPLHLVPSCGLIWDSLKHGKFQDSQSAPMKVQDCQH